MKFKKIMLITLLLLAVLTIGAVSAVDDVASDDLAVSEDVEEVSVDASADSEIIEDSDDAIASSNDDEILSDGEYNITFYEYDEYDQMSDDETRVVDIAVPEGSEGYIEATALEDKEWSIYNSIDDLDQDDNGVYYLVPDSFSELDDGTYTITVSYIEDEKTIASQTGTLTFKSEDDNDEIDYHINVEDEFDVNDENALIFSLVCPDEATGKFFIEVYRHRGEAKLINTYERPIDDSDYDSRIDFTAGQLNITEAGEYSFNVYHLEDDEDEPDEDTQIGSFGSRAIDSNEFRIVDSEEDADVNALAVNIPVFGLYCPNGHEGIVTVTVRLDDDVVSNTSKNINEKNEENIIYWYIPELNLTFIDCKYTIHVNVDEFEDEWSIWFNNPVRLSNESYIYKNSGQHLNSLVTVDVPSEIDEGRIILEVDGDVIFNKTLSEFENAEVASDCYYWFHPAHGPGEGDVRFKVYTIENSIIPDIEAKTYNMTASLVLDKESFISTGDITLKIANVVEKDGIAIELLDIPDEWGIFAFISAPDDANGKIIVTSDEGTLFEENYADLGDCLRIDDIKVDNSGEYEITVAYWDGDEMIVNNTATYYFYAEEDEDDDADDGVVIWVPDGDDKEYDLNNADDLNTPFAFVSVQDDLTGKIVIMVWDDDEDDWQEFFGKDLEAITNKEADSENEGFTIYKISLKDLGNYDDLMECGSFKLAFIDDEDEDEIDSRLYNIDVEENIVAFWEDDDEDDEEIHGVGDEIEARFSDANILDNGAVVTIAKDQIPDDVDNEFTVIMLREDDETMNITLKLDEIDEGDYYIIRVSDLQLPEFRESYDTLMILQFYNEDSEEAYYAEYMDDDEPIIIYESPCIFSETSILNEDDVITIQEIPDGVDSFTITISKEGSEDIVKTFQFSKLVDDWDDVWVAFNLNDLGITETGDYKITVKYSDDLTYSGNLTVTKNVDIRTHELDDDDNLKTFDSVDELVVNFRISENVEGYVKLYVNNTQVGENINLADLRVGSVPPEDGRLIILNDLNIKESGEYTVKVELYSVADELLGEAEFNILVEVGQSSVEINEDSYPYGTEANDEIINYKIGAPLGEGQYYNIYFNGIKAGVITGEGLEFNDEFTDEMFSVLIFKPGNYDVNVTFFDGENETDVTTGSFSINELTLTCDKDVYIFDEDSIIISFNVDSVADEDSLRAYYVYNWGPVGIDADMIFNPYSGEQLKEDGMYEDGVISFDVAWITDEYDNDHYRLDVGTTLIYVTYENATGRYGGFIEVNVVEEPEEHIFMTTSNVNPHFDINTETNVTGKVTIKTDGVEGTCVRDWNLSEIAEYGEDDRWHHDIYIDSNNLDEGEYTITVVYEDEEGNILEYKDFDIVIENGSSTDEQPELFIMWSNYPEWDKVEYFLDSTDMIHIYPNSDDSDFSNIRITVKIGDEIYLNATLANLNLEALINDHNETFYTIGPIHFTKDINPGHYDNVIAYYDSTNYHVTSTDNGMPDYVDLIGDSSVTFSNDIEYTYGENGTTTITLVGATVSQENITVEGFAANISLDGNVITISGLNYGEYTLKVITTPINEYYRSFEGTANIKVNKAKSSISASDIIFDYGGSNSTTVTLGNASDFTYGGNASVGATREGNVITVSGLNPGKYILSITTVPDANYDAVTKNVTVTVNKLATDLTVSIDDINYTDTKIVVHSNVDGDYNITIGEYNTAFTVSEGKGEATIQVLAVSDEKYVATVVFKGNATHAEATITAEFKVDKITPEVNVAIADANVTSTALEITANIDGDYNITIGDFHTDFTVSGGKATVPITPLPASDDKYNATIVFKGNANYTENTTTAKFNINKLTANLTVSVADVNINSTALEITANIDGAYSISFGNFSANFTVSGGKATVPISTTLVANEKITATVVFKGNATYNEASTTDDFSVAGEDSKADVTIPKIEAGKTTKVPIKLASDAKGTVKAIIDGKVVATATLVNGEAVLDIPAQTAGEHTISIAYSGDSKYQAFTKESKVTVKEQSTPTPAKQATKFVAKKKVTFKAKKKVKKFTVTLKTKKGKAVKKVWVTLKIKGKKIIKAKTNNKGKAVFKIKKLTKKGKYTATLKFKGNANYKGATKKAKIIVKK